MTNLKWLSAHFPINRSFYTFETRDIGMNDDSMHLELLHHVAETTKTPLWYGQLAVYRDDFLNQSNNNKNKNKNENRIHNNNDNDGNVPDGTTRKRRFSTQLVSPIHGTSDIIGNSKNQNPTNARNDDNSDPRGLSPIEKQLKQKELGALKEDGGKDGKGSRRSGRGRHHHDRHRKKDKHSRKLEKGGKHGIYSDEITEFFKNLKGEEKLIYENGGVLKHEWRICRFLERSKVYFPHNRFAIVNRGWVMSRHECYPPWKMNGRAVITGYTQLHILFRTPAAVNRPTSHGNVAYGIRATITTKGDFALETVRLDGQKGQKKMKIDTADVDSALHPQYLVEQQQRWLNYRFDDNGTDINSINSMNTNSHHNHESKHNDNDDINDGADNVESEDDDGFDSIPENYKYTSNGEFLFPRSADRSLKRSFVTFVFECFFGDGVC